MGRRAQKAKAVSACCGQADFADRLHLPAVDRLSLLAVDRHSLPAVGRHTVVHAVDRHSLPAVVGRHKTNVPWYDFVF